MRGECKGKTTEEVVADSWYEHTCTKFIKADPPKGADNGCVAAGLHIEAFIRYKGAGTGSGEGLDKDTAEQIRHLYTVYLGDYIKDNTLYTGHDCLSLQPLIARSFRPTYLNHRMYTLQRWICVLDGKKIGRSHDDQVLEPIGQFSNW